MRSCIMLAVQAEGAELMTVEGPASPDGELYPIQRLAVWLPRLDYFEASPTASPLNQPAIMPNSVWNAFHKLSAAVD